MTNGAMTVVTSKRSEGSGIQAVAAKHVEVEALKSFGGAFLSLTKLKILTTTLTAPSPTANPLNLSPTTGAVEVRTLPEGVVNWAIDQNVRVRHDDDPSDWVWYTDKD